MFSLNPNTAEVVLIYQLQHPQIHPPSFKTKPRATFTSQSLQGAGYANKGLWSWQKAHGKQQRPETEECVPKKEYLWDVILGTASVGRVRKCKIHGEKCKVRKEKRLEWLRLLLFNRDDCVPEAGLA